MCQSFSNAADPVPAADDAADVPSAACVAAPAVPAADAAPAVTPTADISTAARVAAPPVVPAAARTSRWPDITDALYDVTLSLDEENGTYIIFLACQ